MVAALVAQAGYGPTEPVLVAVQGRGKPAAYVIQGAAAHGTPLTAVTRVYMASLSKQFTAACVALLVRARQLDMDARLTRWLPELPGWCSAIRLRHLVYHVAGLPDDIDVDVAIGNDDRTTANVVSALRRFPSPRRRPGTAFVYSNAGYVCLALAAQRASGQPLPTFAKQYLFNPLGMQNTLFWPGPAPMPPSSLPLPSTHPAPLSLGDGGAWSTAADLMRWNQAMNADALGISTQLHTPGRLDDGRSLDYGWGVGLRTHAGHPVYRHGGGWSGLRLLLARVPDRQAGLLIIALGDNTERITDLGDALLDTLTAS
jgi:CubicO group peptidase (beta-lactamase class C family)